MNEYSTADNEPESPETIADRRASRRTGMHRVYRAVKARHATTQRPMQTIANWLTEVASSTGFFLFHVVAFTVWIGWNLGVGGLQPFDPFPFGLLTMIVSLEAIFLATFVLMTQSREAGIAELREELTLQINLRIEEEVTKTLHLVAGLYTRLGHTLGADSELREMLQPLDPQKIETEVNDQLQAALPKFRFSARHRNTSGEGQSD